MSEPIDPIEARHQELRARLREQKKLQAMKDLADAMRGKHARNDRPRKTKALRFLKRAAWLREIIEKRKETVNRFAVMSEMDRKTITKILDGKPVQDATIGKLARALKCSHRTIPTN